MLTGKPPAEYNRGMVITVAQSQWCGYRIRGIAANYVFDVWPTPDYPHGREARHIARLWQKHGTSAISGLLLVGCDIAADLDDAAEMGWAIISNPRDVHTGMVKLWPASTGREDWIWSHRGGSLGDPAATQDETAPVMYFSIGFVWLPARLLDLACPAMEAWHWGETDVKLSELALINGIPAHAVRHCRPKHLHFQGEHDGDSIRQRAIRPTQDT